MLTNIFVEIPWAIVASILLFFCWYYPIGLYRNAGATNAVVERGGLMFLLVTSFVLYASTFAIMVVAAIADAETAANIANLLFSLSLIFCGVLASPQALPGFWIFMYRVSPFTYLVDAMLSTAVSNTAAICASNEYLHFNPPSGETCAMYMVSYIAQTGGYLQNPHATSNCSYCQIGNTNAFLSAVSSNPNIAWRNFGIFFVYIIASLACCLFSLFPKFCTILISTQRSILSRQHSYIGLPECQRIHDNESPTSVRKSRAVPKKR